MANLFISFLFFIFIDSLLFGFQAFGVNYDYYFTDECLQNPNDSQYGGGIVVNPELNDGSKGWTAFGSAVLEHRTSEDGNNYIVASRRSHSYDSVTQTFNLEEDKLYTISAWLQVGNGNADIAVIFATKKGYLTAGWVTAQQGCWSMMKGGLSNVSGSAQLYFESGNSGVDIWVDSVSVQPFTSEEWTSHQKQSIDKVRKSKMKILVVDKCNHPVPNATVNITQMVRQFSFGCAMNQYILYNPTYQHWFTQRFNLTVFENELKWYSTEYSRGRVDYSTSDRLVQFCKANNITIRGHNILWDVLDGQPQWVKGLMPNALREAANSRVDSVVNKYKGQFIHWDVVNENLHGHYFEDRLGNNASAVFYNMTSQIDSSPILFLNEYNTIEQAPDSVASPWKYINKVKELRGFGYNESLGIGLEGHFSTPILSYIRASIDVVAALQLPIWVTELDVSSGPNQAFFLEQLLQELHSHPKVDGILLWSAISPQGKCYVMCLTDNNFNNLPTGNVVDNFISQLTHAQDLSGTTDYNGIYEGLFYHGEYEVNVSHLSGFSTSKRIQVVPRGEGPNKMHTFSIDIEI